MQIYYSRKHIFWDNKNNDQLERDVFETYLDDWVMLSNKKSINWTDHYTANFYATDAFNATYFKIVKGDKTYYFFIEDKQFDSVNGTQYFLTMDFYNTYTSQLIEILKQQDPLVMFKRKHCNRFFKEDGKYNISIDKQNYLLNIPSQFSNMDSKRLPYALEDVSHTGSDDVEDCTKDSTSFWNFNPSEYRDKNGRYWYLKVNRPQLFSNKLKNYNYSPVFFIPVNQNTWASNSWDYCSKWPSNYVIGLISCAIDPSMFGCGTMVKTIYAEEKDESKGLDDRGEYPTYSIFQNDTTIILTPKFNNVVNFDYYLRYNINNMLSTSTIENYSIDWYENEVCLWLDPFFTIKVNDTLNISNNYLIGKNFMDTNIKTDMRILFSTDIYATYNYDASLLSYSNVSIYPIPITETHPFVSSALSAYLVNNINSINTGIQLAKEQKAISDKYAGLNMSIGVMSGIGSMGIGAAASFKNPIAGAQMMNKGSTTALNSIIGGAETLEMNAFNLKAKIASTEAAVKDIKNQPSTITDTYGKGLCNLMNKSALYVNYERLPNNILKTVFSDYYFNGYVFESVDNFSTYNNRVSFNYFEIANAFHLATRYLSLPKRILTDIASQLETGVRLWKTTNIDPTMKTDNREVSYA